MQFAAPNRRHRPAENIVPMINVVFLLLIFFLMSAQITTPPPVDISLPQSASTASPEAPDTLFIAADSVPHYQGLHGQDALNALAAGGFDRIKIEADRAADVADFASLLRGLRSFGIAEIDLVTRAP